MEIHETMGKRNQKELGLNKFWDKTMRWCEKCWWIPAVLYVFYIGVHIMQFIYKNNGRVK